MHLFKNQIPILGIRYSQIQPTSVPVLAGELVHEDVDADGLLVPVEPRGDPAAQPGLVKELPRRV